MILVGASTGGPKVLLSLTKKLPLGIPPIIWVNHIGEGGHLDVLVNHVNRESKIQASIAKDGEIPKRNQVYLCPAGYHLQIDKDVNGRLSVVKGQPYKHCLPSVNKLFSSALPYAQTHNVLVIILTGMGDDGVEGLRDLKQAKVKVITQSEESSMIYGMPRAVHHAGLSDYILSPEEIGEFISSPTKAALQILNQNKRKEKMTFTSNPVGLSDSIINLPKDKDKSLVDAYRKMRSLNQEVYSKGSQVETRKEMHSSSTISLFKELVVKTTGNITFEDRSSLLVSKLEKFLYREKCEDLRALYQKCTHDEILLNSIVGEMTIHESMFFRDKVPFEFLKNVVFPNHQLGERLKVWSACCAMGQEPYSILMCGEEFSNHQNKVNVEVTATDIDMACLSVGELGGYSKFQTLRGLDEARLNKYFRYDDQNKKYYAKDRLKGKVVFSHFNLIRDNYQKFKGVDVIFCRYTLIYFDPKYQMDILDKLVDVLIPNGYLILDPATSMKVKHKRLKATSYNGSTFFRKVS